MTKRLPSGEWYAEWTLEGYQDFAVHGMSFTDQSEIAAYETTAHAALVEVMRSCFYIDP